jgi:DNA segregation ATPase FtsK/SpoIIIE, S-DNA-T family
MAAARRNQGPGKPVTGMIMLGAAAAAGYAIYNGFPGIAALWAGLVVSAWMYPPMVLTGKKDSRGYPTAAHPGEQAEMNKFRLWSDLKYKLLVPSMDWLPGFKPQLSWLAAVWAGAAAYLIPVTDTQYTAGYGQWIDAAAAFISVAQFTASRRRTEVADDENPGASFDVLISLAKKDRAKVIGLTIGGFVLAAVVGTVVTVMVPLATKAAHLPAIPEPAIWALMLTGGPLVLLARPWITEALEHWRVVVAAREEWRSRWEMLKQDPAPRLVDRQEVGPATIDTFDAPGSMGAMAYWSMGAKIGPTLGTGAKFAVLDTPNLDSNNQPVPGTRHPLRFDFIKWPSDQMPDVSDPATPKEVVFQLARCALAWMAESTGCARPILDEVHPLTIPAVPAEPAAESEEAAPATAGGGAAWAMTWHAPEGPPASYLRNDGRGALQAALGSQVLVDHRAMNDAGAAYFGAITAPDTQWEPSCGVNTAEMERLMTEDTWNSRWAEAAPAHSTNPPVAQIPTSTTARLKGGAVIESLSFVTRQGMTPHDFFKFENKLPTVLNAAPFVAMTGYSGVGGRPGDRHPQAFTVYWSKDPVPAKPDVLAPVPADRRAGIHTASEAPKWVLAGLVNQAFAACKMPDRPEVVSVSCLTKPESRQHIWRIDLRLYGGVTLADVRTAANRIRQHWGSEWLRVAEAADGCTIVVGARPSRVKLAEPRHERYLEALNWNQVFLDSRISGTGGLLPVLTNVGHMEHNQQVSILDFDLPAGIVYADLRGKINDLEGNSGNTYVEVRRVKDKANQVQLLVSEVSPMPELAPYDYPAIEASENIPFATGVEGQPVEFDIRRHIHLMIVGGSGSGKSVILQSLITGALVRGCDLYIADPTKAAADFTFAEPYSMAFCKDLMDTGAMMKGVYQEVKRRVALNSQYGAGSYRDLPESIRPRHIVVVLDEFTSLIAPDAVSKTPSDDPEVEAEREMALAINAAKTEVGAYTGKFAREARSAGVTLVLASQKVTQKDLDQMPGGSTLKVNLSRLIAGKSTPGERMSALKDAMNAPALGDSIPPGRAIFEPVTSGPVLIQCWYDKNEQAALSEFVGKHREVLDEAAKLDLSKYRRKAVAISGDALPTIVDLGELSLDLGDLEFTLDDEDSPVSRFTEEIQDAALFYDVDGTLCPFRHTEELEKIIIPGHGTQAYNKQLVERLAALPLDQAWLTSWFEDAPDYLGDLFPRAIDVLNSDTEETGLWKIDAVLAWLADRPHIRRIVWMDDELLKEDPLLGISYRDIAMEAFDAADIKAHLVLTDSDEGITEADVDGIEDFLAAWIPAPAPEEEAVPADDWSDWTPEPAPAQGFEDWSDVAAAVPAATSWDAAPAAGWDEGAPEPSRVPATVGTAVADPFAEPAPKSRRRRFNLPADEDPFA